MRSYGYLLALLPLQLVSAVKAEDTTVIVTQKRTVTVCPLTQLNICEHESVFDPTAALTTNLASLPTVSASVTRFWSDWKPDTSSLSSSGVSTTVTVTSFGYGSHTSGYGYGTSSTVATYNGTSSTTTSRNSTSTTSKLCPNFTLTSVQDNKCNHPGDRSKWCGGKDINSDTHKTYRTGQTKRFALTITNTTLDFDGVQRPSFAINGQSPGPAIEANWGDMIEVVVTNLLQDNATTIHWHGIRQHGTNDQDGVPGVTECGIAPGQSKVYTWLASSYGTGWYHSHLLSQYGGGIRGPVIIHGPATANYDIDMGTVMIDDIFDGTIFEMAWRASHVGQVNTANYLLNGKNVAPDMSRGDHRHWTLKPNKKHLFRIINSSGQNAYAVHFDNHKMQVIAADFTPIVPYETDWLYITNGERFDVIIEANQPVSSYFLRAVTQTGCPSICANNGLGLANGIFSYEGDCGTFPTTDLAGINATTAFSGCKDEPLSSLRPWVSKSAGSEAELRASLRTIAGTTAARTQVGTSGFIFRWFLNGNAMNLTYTQPTLKTLDTVPQSSINGSSLNNAIVINSATEDQWVYFVIQNSFFVSHPMHLHGHDFSILGSGVGLFTDSMIPTLNFNNPIRRDTALLFGSRATGGAGVPSGYTVIGWQTDNPGAWLMHCHLIFHAEGGMAMQFIERPDQISKAKYYDSDFKDQCRALEAYEAQGPHRNKAEYESGLRKRLEEHKAKRPFGYEQGHAVRHA